MVQTVSGPYKAFRATDVTACDGHLIMIYNRTHDEVESDVGQYLRYAPFCGIFPVDLTRDVDATGWSHEKEFFCMLLNDANKSGDYTFRLYHEGELKFTYAVELSLQWSAFWYAGNGEMPGDGVYTVKLFDPDNIQIYIQDFKLINYTPPPPPPIGIFLTIANYFHSMSEYPVLGDTFDYIGTAFETVDGWMTTVNTALSNILSWSAIKAQIDTTYSILAETKATIVAAAIASAAATWSILAETKATIVAAAKTAVLGTYASLDLWFDSKTEAISAVIIGAYPTIEWWFEDQKDIVKAWVLGTYTDLDAWLSAHFDSIVAAVIAQVPEISAYITEHAAEILDTLLGTYTDLGDWFDAQQTVVKRWILGTYASLDLWFDSKTEAISAVVIGAYPTIEWWFEDQKDIVKAWVLGTYASIDTWFDAQKAKVLAWVSTAFSIVNHSWQEVLDLIEAAEGLLPDWFPTSLEDLKNLINDTVSSTFTILSETKASIVAAAIASAAATWSILAETKATIVAAAKTAVLGAYSSIDSWFVSKRAIVELWVKTLFPYDITDAQAFLRWLGIEAGEVITTILDTPADMFAWIRSEIEAAYTIVTHTWQDVLDAIDAAAGVLPTWFPTSLEDLKNLINDTVSSTFTILSETKASIVAAAKTAVLGAYTTLDGWFNAQKDKIISWVVMEAESILDEVFK